MSKPEVWHFCNPLGVQCALETLYVWQTMITGVLAVTAALIAAGLANKQLRIGRDQVQAARDQIKAQIDDEEDRRRRALRAARASLPGVLTAICDHAEDVLTALTDAWNVRSRRAGGGPVRDLDVVTVDVARFPESLVKPLQEILLHVDDDAVHDRIASIFREAQVLDARTRPLAAGRDITASWHKEMLIQALALHARATSLFAFARGSSDTVEDDLWDRVHSAVSVTHLDLHFLIDQIERDRDQGLSPGEGDIKSIAQILQQRRGRMVANR
ncbi:hypothetical protein [Sphingomonas yabuuchiae]|uniref:Uncharacterized protein n=1 Tax=Sphingomonas yabuuchiae TaxID=172044 RepID=A0AA41DF01_9SPHN|nr:hypothetical protein [Sphingomonas yabuuchiae]MBB4609609.1 hypothetical protein [Sphingomonas yabuuchiae]MBN3557920.1 hypothetical protein [Sphingomonas yabuuchiae]